MEQKLKTDFDKFISTSNFSNQEIKLKKEALDKFLKNGFPSRKLENWKFLDINQIIKKNIGELTFYKCLLYTSPSPRDGRISRMPSSA